MDEQTIQDLMVPLKEYAAVSQEAGLYEVIEALETVRERYKWRRYKHRAVLLLDDRKRIIGKVRPHEILNGLESGYKKMRNIGRLTSSAELSQEAVDAMMKDFDLWQEPLPDICRRAARMPVKDMMHKFSELEYIALERPLVEAIHRMIVGQYMSLLVTVGDDVVGVLRMTDVFTELSQMIKEYKPSAAAD